MFVNWTKYFHGLTKRFVVPSKKLLSIQTNRFLYGENLLRNFIESLVNHSWFIEIVGNILLENFLRVIVV